MENSRTSWHSLMPEEAISKTGSRISGLTEKEAKERLVQYGSNELIGKKKASLILLFLQQFLSPLVYVLLAAGGLFAFEEVRKAIFPRLYNFGKYSPTNRD